MPFEFTGRGDPRRSLILLWRRGERAARGPKPVLTVDAIVERAIEIADADGLAAVSMRRVAESLGVGTMSLYRHVPGKGELIDLMLDRAVAESVPKEPVAGWRAKLERHAREGMEHYRRHPWALEVSMTRPPLGPNIMASFESLLTAVAETGLPVEEWAPLSQTIGAYVEGAARWQVSAAQAERETGVSDTAWWAEREEFWEEYFVPEDHPTISRTYDDGGFEETIDPFELGLEVLLDGVEARVAARRGGT
jgi:AcrR family transcriptional regulator